MNQIMPRKFSVTLPDTVAVKLDRWSEARGQAFATVAAVAIELAVRQAESEGEIPPEAKGDRTNPKPEN